MRFWLLFFLYAALFLSLKSVWPLTGDFFLLAVITFGFLEGGIRAIGLAWFLGFLLDVVSVGPLGASLFSYSVVFLLIRLLRAKIFFQSWLSKFFWVALFSLVNDGVVWTWTALLTPIDHPLLWILRISLWNALINGLLGLFWIDFLSWYWGLNPSEEYGVKAGPYPRTRT